MAAFPLRRAPRAILAVAITGSLMHASAWAACSPGAGGFGPAVAYPAGASPAGMVVGDFDHDGVPDLVVAASHLWFSPGAGSLEFLKGNGDGSFALPLAFGAGIAPLFVAAGDLNGDGKLDVVATDYSSHVVRVSLGTGDGQFLPGVEYAAGSNPHHLALADLDGDGILDLVVGDAGDSQVLVFHGNGANHVGDGTFSPAVSYLLANLCTGVAVGDVTGDGIPDIVATEYTSGTLAVLRGDGNGGVTSVAHVSVGQVVPYHVALHDLNGDGRLDAVVTNQGSGGTRLLLGSGAGTFGAPTALLSSGSCNDIRFADVNGDGRTDIVVSVSDQNRLAVLLGQGVGASNNGQFLEGPSLAGGQFPVDVVLADLDGDGLLDVVTTNYASTTITLHPGTCSSVAPAFALGRVRDVPNDQGGRVWLTWPGHAQDAPFGAVIEYRVWRRVPGPAPGARAARRTTIENGQVVYWEAAATLPAQRLPGYGFTAQTPQDSLASGNPYTAFFVTAATADPDVFFDTPVDSGYSVDNLSPAPVSQLQAVYQAGGVVLRWAPSLESDLGGYRVHRGADPFFVPGPANLAGAPSAPAFTDDQSAAWYKVAAVDVHGNVGAFALVQPMGAVGVEVAFVASAFDAEGVTLTWYADAGIVPWATLERDDGDGGWHAVGSGMPDAGGALVLHDASVTPGASYRYRLTWMTPDGARSSPIASVTIPGRTLALAGARPNPAPRGECALRFTLPDAAPATLEIFEVGGRRVFSRAVGSLGPGDHVLSLGPARLAPGLYLARLVRGGEQRRARIVVVP
jgi:hypothetical protein